MPPRSLSKTMRLPSGEKAGAVSIDEAAGQLRLPARRRGRSTKMSDPVPTDIEKTARRPSGEKRGAKVMPRGVVDHRPLPPPASISITCGAPCS